MVSAVKLFKFSFFLYILSQPVFLAAGKKKSKPSERYGPMTTGVDELIFAVQQNQAAHRVQEEHQEEMGSMKEYSSEKTESEESLEDNDYEIPSYQRPPHEHQEVTGRMKEHTNNNRNSRIKNTNKSKPELLDYYKELRYCNDMVTRHEDTVYCGKAYLIREKKREFKLVSPGQQCNLTFSGSILDKCTVAIKCEAKLEDCRHGNGYFIVRDATNGREQYFDCSKFDNIPIHARNGGTDLYVEYKGWFQGANCIAFCIEDEMHINVRELNNSLSERKIEDRCVCGLRNSETQTRVVNGKEATKFEFPWISPIVVRGSRSPFCGAVLINDRYALTAAHCFDGGSFQNKSNPADILQLLFHSHVMDGKKFQWAYELYNLETILNIPGYNLPTDYDSEKSLRVNISNLLLHPNYQPKKLDYDIAILELNQKVELHYLMDGHVLPICLPEVNDRFVDFTNKTMTVAGWGRYDPKLDSHTRTLQKLDMETAECALGSSTRRHFCAGDVKGGKGACKGDSGGPLITPFKGDIANQYILAGIASGANSVDCTKEGWPALYTNVQELVQWVYDNTRDGVFCSKSDKSKEGFKNDRVIARNRKRRPNGRGRNLDQEDKEIFADTTELPGVNSHHNAN